MKLKSKEYRKITSKKFSHTSVMNEATSPALKNSSLSSKEYIAYATKMKTI